MQVFSWILLVCWIVITTCWVLLTREWLVEVKRKRRKRAVAATLPFEAKKGGADGSVS